MKKLFNDAELKALEKNRNPRSFYCFVPHRLEIKDLPKYNNFPFNILFVSYANINGVDTSGSAIYNPDFSTFQDDENKQSMIYYNQYDDDRNWTVMIVYDKQKESWEGIKYCKSESRGSGYGTQWDKFFVHLTAIGLVKGERVKFEKM
jgi:hypothetical protein